MILCSDINSLIDVILNYDISDLEALNKFRCDYVNRKSKLAPYFSVLKESDNREVLGELLNKAKAILQIKYELFYWILQNEKKYNLYD